jgi:hypothetical protein
MSPKITVHGGATNAREAALSPDAGASTPLVGAEADQGHPPVVTETVPELVTADEALAAPVVDADEAELDPYVGKTLGELRDLAVARGVAAYGSKSQLADRLRAADAEE